MLNNRRGCYFSLAASIGSMGIAWGSLSNFQPSDRISVQRGAFLTTLGFVYFVSLTNFLNKFLLESPIGLKIRKKFRLRLSDVLDITNRLVSATQALLSSLAGALVCRYSCAISMLHGSYFLLEGYAWFGAAYFIYDIWSMYKVHAAVTAQKIAEKLKIVSRNNGTSTNGGSTSDENTKMNGGNGNIMYDKLTNEDTNTTNNSQTSNGCLESEKQVFEYDNKMRISGTGFFKYMITHPLMMIHHIFIGTFGLLTITYLRGGLGDCIFSYFYMMEISTPFVSFRSVLSRLNLKNTKAYVINGLLMIIFFLVFRVLLLPYLFYTYSVFVNLPIFQAIAGLPRTCKISICILFIPQYYWFYLMMKGATKVFFPPKPDKLKTSKCIDVDNEVISQKNNNKSSAGDVHHNDETEILVKTPDDDSDNSFL